MEATQQDYDLAFFLWKRRNGIRQDAEALWEEMLDVQKEPMLMETIAIHKFQLLAEKPAGEINIFDVAKRVAQRQTIVLDQDNHVETLETAAKLVELLRKSKLTLKDLQELWQP